MTFKDHFSDGSKEYADFRPRYPDELFAYLANLCGAQNVAWDCATGSGQAALGLAQLFPTVWATDASANQIANAAPVNGVTYRVATAENSGLDTESIDLITVAQALHWFNIDGFSQEVLRVLKSDGILAAWTYGLPEIEETLDQCLVYLYRDILDPFWPPERKLVEDGYADIRLPLRELVCSPFEMHAAWNFAQFIGYLNTWSAGRRYANHYGQNPVDTVRSKFLEAWGKPEYVRQVRWPLTIRVWKKALE